MADLIPAATVPPDDAPPPYVATEQTPLTAAITAALTGAGYTESLAGVDDAYTAGWTLGYTEDPAIAHVLHWDGDSHDTPFDRLPSADQAAYCAQTARYQTALNGAGLCATWHTWGDGSPYLVVRAGVPPAYDASQDPAIMAGLWGEGAGAVALHPVRFTPPLAGRSIDPYPEDEGEA